MIELAAYQLALIIVGSLMLGGLMGVFVMCACVAARMADEAAGGEGRIVYLEPDGKGGVREWPA